MALEYIEFLRETFGDTDSLNLEQTKKLILETNAYFATLENALKNGDAKAREEAIAAALEVKAYLDSKSDQPSKFLALETLSEEEREIISEANTGLKLVKEGKSKAKVKKLKPIKLS